MSQSGLHTSEIKGLPLVYRGKVRDIYEIDDTHWLIITSDRVSAFDVIMPTVVPNKGKLLTELALFWFEKMSGKIGNHLSDLKLEDVLSNESDLTQARGRSMLVKKLKPLRLQNKCPCLWS